jgi:hypothetical protein
MASNAGTSVVHLADVTPKAIPAAAAALAPAPAYKDNIEVDP